MRSEIFNSPAESVLVGEIRHLLNLQFNSICALSKYLWVQRQNIFYVICSKQNQLLPVLLCILMQTYSMIHVYT